MRTREGAGSYPALPPGFPREPLPFELDVDDFELADSLRRVNLHGLAALLPHEGPSDRALEGDLARLHVGFILADDPIGNLLVRIEVGGDHRTAEGHLVGALQPSVDHLRAREPVVQIAN